MCKGWIYYELTPAKLDFNILRKSTLDIPTWKGICVQLEVSNNEHIILQPMEHTVH